MATKTCCNAPGLIYRGLNFLTSKFHQSKEPTMSTSKIFRVKSSDGEIFEVPEAVAVQSQMISYMVEDGCVDTKIPITICHWHD